MQRNGKSGRKTEELLKLRDAALQLGISFPTIKQWIYKKKIRSIRTAGGHHRIPESEVDRLLFRTRGKTEKERKLAIRRCSGRNQLVGRIDTVRISGLMAEIDELYVPREMRSRGVGSLLVTAAQGDMAARGLVRLQLQLGVDNVRGRAFYERHGFSRRAGFELLDKPL